MSKLKKQGFTLIELLIVIAIIAILLTILAPALYKAREQAKLSLCASNQRQVVMALKTYASEYQMRLPPAVTKTARPTLLARFKSNGDTAVGFYLRRYVSNADAFNCPLSAFDKNAKYDIDGQYYTYQDLYDDPTILQNSVSANKMQNSSYMLLWNYEAFNKSSVRVDNSNNIYNKPFIGAGKKSNNDLAICDSFYYSNQLGGEVNYHWSSNHPIENSDKYKSRDYPYFLLPGTEQEFGTNDDLHEIILNAGYTDGHVERYLSGNTIRQQAVKGWAALYIPEKWK